MKIYTNNKFKGVYPIGTAAVIVANDKYEAARLLSDALFDTGIPDDNTIDGMIEIDISSPNAIILCNGDY